MASRRRRGSRARLRWLCAAAATLPALGIAQEQDARGSERAEPPSAAPASPDTRCPQQQPIESGRRSASVPVLPWEPTPCEPARLPTLPGAALADFASIPDRWRIVSMLGYEENLLDPYSGNNWLKGDRPAWGEDWFANLLIISDSVAEPRRFAVPVGGPVTEEPGSLD